METNVKTIYDILKDVVIPILSPMLAVITFLLFFWQEKKKASLQSKYQLDSGANSVLRDVILFREAYQLFSLSIQPTNNITNQHVLQLKELYSKLHNSITQNPDVFHVYIKKGYSDASKNNLPLLMIELQRKIASLTTSSKIDNFILFGTYTFLYLFESENELIFENKKIRKQIRDTDPFFFDQFMVNRKDGK